MIKDYSNQPIMVTGCARSGTSMVAGIIHLCGAWKGDTAGPNKHNKKGMFENHAIRQNVIKPYFLSMRCDKLGQYPLPNINKLLIPNDFQEKILTIIKEQGWDSTKKWMYKGAKMCLIWPVLHYAFPDSKWIVVRRKTSDIVNSCMKTSFMRAFANTSNQRKVRASNEKEGWLWWVRQHEKRFSEMVEKGLNVKVVWPERMINSNYEQMKETIEWLGLTWNEKAVVDFIDPKLWKARNI